MKTFHLCLALIVISCKGVTSLLTQSRDSSLVSMKGGYKSIPIKQLQETKWFKREENSDENEIDVEEYEEDYDEVKEDEEEAVDENENENENEDEDEDKESAFDPENRSTTPIATLYYDEVNGNWYAGYGGSQYKLSDSNESLQFFLKWNHDNSNEISSRGRAQRSQWGTNPLYDNSPFFNHQLQY